MPHTNSEIVLEVIRATGPTTSKTIVQATGLSKGTVSKAIGRLVESGTIQRGVNGSVSAKREKQ